MGESQQDLILENGQGIRTWQNYKYLGVNNTNDGTLYDGIKDGKIQRSKAAAMWNSIFYEGEVGEKE